MPRLVGVPEPVTVRIPAKVNLHLSVGDRREDGYHDLVTVFHAVSLYDEVTATPARDLSVAVTGEGAAELPAGEDNIAWRAAVTLARHTGVEPAVRIELAKGIPVAGGLAGGSADAAGTLVACDALWGTGLGRDELLDLAAEIGSDVAFALTGGTALGTGRGERLTPVLAVGRWHWVLAIADGGLATPRVYAELDRQRADGGPTAIGPADDLINALRTHDPARLGRLLANDLDPPARRMRPELSRTVDAGLDLGAVGGVISGSGPTVAFLARSSDRAVRLAAALAGAGVCRTVRTAYGPVPGARIVADEGLMAAANLVNAEAVSKSYGARTVLDHVSLGVAAGERIGVVGRNGGGKTTLLDLLGGAVEPDSGRVTRTRGLRLGRVGQGSELPAGTVRELVVGAAAFDAEHEWAGDSAVRAVLAGLGLTRLGLDSDVAALSGGERRRVALAARLVHPTDLLVLDEPTNHLDVEGVAWLAGHLRQRPGALLVVTHDRWFLDAVVQTTWEVADGRVRSYDGGYAAYVLARAERERQAAAGEARRTNLLRKELAWLRRGPPARTSKPRFRIEAAQALIADEPPPRDAVSLQTFAARRLGRTVYELTDVSVVAGGHPILDRVDRAIGPGDRIGVVGVNGSGKTTLLRLLTGELVPDSGRVVVGKTVRAAYLSQDVAELPGDKRALEVVSEVAQYARLGGVELSAAQLAERFGFAAGQHWTPVAELSGGERRRLQLLRLLMAEPNVLLLDEPTNDLDIDTLTALEDLLDSWSGTLVVVSHDRYLIERVCDSVVALLGDGTLSTLPGGVEEYLSRRAEAVAAAAGPVGAPRPRRGDSREARRELARTERQIEALRRRESGLHAELAEHATDYAKVAELDAELRAVTAERDAAETRWLELADDA